MRDFKMKNVICRETGSWDAYNGEFNINYSSILTRLIQSAGRFCIHHASDLFIDWKNLDDQLHERDFVGGKYLFGMRKDGVDGESYIIRNAENGRSLYNYYMEMFMLEITVDDDQITMMLGEVSF